MSTSETASWSSCALRLASLRCKGITGGGLPGKVYDGKRKAVWNKGGASVDFVDRITEKTAESAYQRVPLAWVSTTPISTLDA